MYFYIFRVIVCLSTHKYIDFALLGFPVAIELQSNEKNAFRFGVLGHIHVVPGLRVGVA